MSEIAILRQLRSVGLHFRLKAYGDRAAFFCRRFKLPLAYYTDSEVIETRSTTIPAVSTDENGDSAH
jgi:hypothetical protein